MGNAASTLDRWHSDTLSDCSEEDRIWGWSIRSSEVLHDQRTKMKDDVLYSMLKMSLLDKKEGAPAWTETVSVKQGVRLVANAIVRVVQKVLKQDDKVRHPGGLLWMRLTG